MRNLLILVFALRSAFAFAASDEAKAVDTAKAFVEALRVHDYEKMVSLLPPPIVKAQGGKEKIVAALEAAKTTADVAIESASFDEHPQKIEATDALIYFVKADVFSLYKRQTRIVAHTFYVSFRFKDQSSWQVLDGSKFGQAQLRKIFRGLPESFSVPKVAAEVVKEEPNQSPEPTPAAGTSAAEQPLVPAAVVAHL